MKIKLDIAVWTAVSSRPQLDNSYHADQKKLADAEIDKLRERGIDATMVQHLDVPGESRSLESIEIAAEKIPAYAHLIELAESHQINCLMYYEYSRLGRDLILLEQVSRLCIKNGVLMYEITRPPYELSVESQKFDVLSRIIEGYQAQSYIRRLVEHRHRGMVKRIVQEKKFPKGKKYGYDTDRNIVEPEAEIIRKIIELYLSGNGFRLIALAIGEYGRPAPGGGDTWHWGSIRNIIDSAWIYAGYLIYNAQSEHETIKVRGEHEPIISELDAERCQKELALRANARRLATSTSRWSGMVYCQKCRGRAKREHIEKPAKSGGLRIYDYFYCSACGPPRAKGADINATFRQYIVGKMNEYNARYAEEPSDNSAEIDKLSRELAKYPARFRTIDSDRADGFLSRDRYMDQINRLNSEVASIKRRIEELSEVPVDPAVIVDALADVLDRLDNDSDTAINMWLRTQFKILIDGKNVSVEVFD